MLKRDISRTNVFIAAAGGMIGSGWLRPFYQCTDGWKRRINQLDFGSYFLNCLSPCHCVAGDNVPYHVKKQQDIDLG